MLDFRDRKIRQLFIVCVVGFVALMLLASAYALQRMQRQKIESSLDLASLQAASFEDYLTQYFNNIDLTLHNIPSLQESVYPALDIFSLALRNAPHLRSISMLDNQGRIYSSSNPHNLGKTIDLTTFMPAAELAGEQLLIGRPWAGRDIADGHETSPAWPTSPDEQLFLPVLHKAPTGAQPFALLATVNTDYFLNHFSKHVPAENGYVELVRTDRTILFSSNEKQPSGSLHTDSPLLTHNHKPSGAEEQNIENHALLTASRASRNFPFEVHVYLERSQQLSQWNTQLRIMLALVGASVLAVSAFAVFIYRRLHRAARIQEAADEQLRLSAQVFKSSAEAIFIATADLQIYTVNRAFAQITGYSASDVIGHTPALLCADQTGLEQQKEWIAIRPSAPWIGEASFRRQNGELYPALLTISCVTDDNNAITHYIGVFSDATERKVSERLRFLSEHDFLTGLPNRRLFQEHFEQSVARIQRHGGHLALLFLDLDHFKDVNDTLGHHVGDLLLKEVAERLRACVRATDTVCRQGGDEFLLLIDVIEDADDTASVAKKLIEQIGSPYEIEGHTMSVTPSIGIALFPDHGQDSATLIHRADVAMYQAKHRGRNHFCLYHKEMEATHTEFSALRTKSSDPQAPR